MSSVFLHVGQCGVQVGENLWTTVSQRNDRDVRHTMFAHGSSNTPRALFIDAEKKVIARFASNVKKSKVKLNVNGNSLYGKTGCGSNWAFGRNKLAKTIIGDNLPSFDGTGYASRPDVDKDSSYLEVCSEMIRLKVESCDSFSGFCVTHSLAGGTGSGFGSRLAIELHDLYPTNYRLWNVVMPYSSGESACQSYNQLLCFATLQQYADAIVVFDNEFLTDQLFKTKEKVTMEHLNKSIADTMLGCYLPVSMLKSDPNLVSIGSEPWELIRSVAPMPTLKFLQMRHVAANPRKPVTDSRSWCDKLIQRMGTQVKQDTWRDGVCRQSIAAVSVCRSFPRQLRQRVAEKLESSFKFVKWNPFPVDVWMDEESRDVRGHVRSMSVCSNSSSVVEDHVTPTLRRARRMHQHGAYLHWYRKHLPDDSDCFDSAFRVIENLVLDYREAVA